MKLYNYWRSSSSWRVRIALACKGLPYEYIPVHLLRDGGEQHRQTYLSLNPMGEVPSLMVRRGESEAVLCQSMAILEYLEEAHPQPPLLPADLWLRAKVRQIANIISSGMQPLHNLGVLQKVESLGGDKNAWAESWLHRGLRAIEHEAAALAGQCMVGDAVTLADVCLVPQLAGCRRFDIDLGRYPLLSRIETHLNSLAAFREAHAERQIDAPAPQGV